MDKFTIPKNSWTKGDTYLSFFIWQGKVYPVGATITLNAKGMKSVVRKYWASRIYLKAHYFDGVTERWSYGFEGQDRRRVPYKDVNNLGLDTYIDSPDDFIESIDAEPLDSDPQEYIDYIKSYTENYYEKHLTPEENEKVMEAIKNGKPAKSAMPERFKNNPNVIPTPSFNDFNCKGMIGGWIIFAFVIFAASVFNDWYIQWIIRIYAVWQFTIWRRNKLYGIK